MRNRVAERFDSEFGPSVRNTVKVKAWALTPDVGAVLQIDSPNLEDAACVWLPYPGPGQAFPELALEYPGEAGRHSGTYASAGLRRGEPALKLTIRSTSELDATVKYVRAIMARSPLPAVPRDAHISFVPNPAAVGLPLAVDVKPRREAIPRAVQREVWQRDGGRCVECETREKLCFDHIVPFSRGGSNSIRNLQLLCERCNLSKGNRI